MEHIVGVQLNTRHSVCRCILGSAFLAYCVEPGYNINQPFRAKLLENWLRSEMYEVNQNGNVCLVKYWVFIVLDALGEQISDRV